MGGLSVRALVAQNVGFPIPKRFVSMGSVPSDPGLVTALVRYVRTCILEPPWTLQYSEEYNLRYFWNEDTDEALWDWEDIPNVTVMYLPRVVRWYL